MPVNFQLRYLKRDKIDIAAWDACIERSSNGLIYARSFYLDHMADSWDAVVMNNYEAVMPLPWRKKWGIRYVYQLPFVQRLGIYGTSLTEETVTKFYREALTHNPFLHYKTDLAFANDEMRIRTFRNFVIDLSQPYNLIRNAFNEECRKNIRKAENRGCMLSRNVTASEVVHFFEAAYGKYYPQYNEAIYQKLSLLITKGIETGKCETWSVVNKENTTVFTAALLKDEKRIYYCVGAPNEEGRQMRATYFFINEMLKQNASQPLLFDFEGSELPNVASFYSKFGPETEMYEEIRMNKLPWPLRWLKK